MGKETGIAWTRHTFNPWWGCTKVSPGCDNCYAETFDRRVHGVGKGHWGKDAPRRAFGENHWNEPMKWNKAAEKARTPALVFCASMADWCDADAPAGALERLHVLWRATPWLRWQMLTKRPGRIARSLPVDWGDGYANVWLGTTVEDQQHAEQRIPILLSAPARVRFLSMEPLLGAVDLWSSWLLVPDDSHSRAQHVGARIDWVIVGGESGHGARPFNLAWARSIKAQCDTAGVAFFMKQLGSYARGVRDDHVFPFNYGRYATDKDRLTFTDAKGGDMAEWPKDLRVQHFPEAP